MRIVRLSLAATALLSSAFFSGCQSPYRADQGALVGGLGGLAVGSIVGKQLGNTAAGAAIGTVTGLATGSIIGNEMDKEARNRAEIEARLGAAAPAGAVSIDDVIAMTRSGVDDEIIASHVRIHGVSQPLSSADLITLKQNGVGTRVVQAMQQPRPATAAPAVATTRQPVIVEEHYYSPPPPWWGFGYHRGRHHHHRGRGPSYSFGLSWH